MASIPTKCPVCERHGKSTKCWIVPGHPLLPFETESGPKAGIDMKCHAEHYFQAFIPAPTVDIGLIIPGLSPQLVLKR